MAANKRQLERAEWIAIPLIPDAEPNRNDLAIYFLLSNLFRERRDGRGVLAEVQSGQSI
jgi:hypothetical protein